VEPEQPHTRGLVTHLAHIASIVRAGRRAAPSCLVLSVLPMVPAACGATSASSTTRSFTATQTTLAVRSCKTAVYGQLAHGWRSSPDTVRAGVISFLYGRSYRNAPPRQFRESGSGASLRYPGQKLLVVVDRGATVTVEIGSEDQGRTSLQYQPAIPDPPYRISQGTTAVEFEGCPHASTQFNGGFIVAGPRCVEVDVQYQGKLTRAWIPFGTGQQPCPRR
jgi:hypothetical protein